MKEFTYLGLKFEPIRNITDKESDELSRYIRPCPFSPANFNSDEFYAAAEFAGKDNRVDLFQCNGEIVIPCSQTLQIWRDSTLPDHYLRETEKPLNATASLSTLLAVMDETGKEGFYPTPERLASEMVSAVDLDFVSTVLEPSAGKGDLLDALKRRMEVHYYGNHELDADCVEINPDLRLILKGKGYRVVHDDFLTFSTYKHYSLILMNPPFKDADKHLMKALDLMSNGGQIVCLLNAETIRNPCTNLRRELRKRLETNDAQITYYQDSFKNAQRKTGVEIAMVSVKLPQETRRSDIYDRMEKADYEAHADTAVEDLAPADFIERITRQFKIETDAGMELIRQYRAMQPYMLDFISTGDKEKDAERGHSYGGSPILTLGVYGKDSGDTINSYLKATRYKYWDTLLNNSEFTGKLTADLQKKYRQRVEDLSNYDFTPFNIQCVAVEMNAEIFTGVEEAILKIFDQLTCEHAWYPECKGNIHYYNGWAHNKAHKIAQKVIIPSYGIFPDYSWSHDTFRIHEAYNHLADIEKCFNYLDGHTTAEVDLSKQLHIANDSGITKNIHCKFFDVTFYKKGTTHIKFTNQKLLDKFNIYCSRKRGWLPPRSYKVAYEDLGREEKEVIDDFQGKDSYEAVRRNSKWYLPETSDLLALPSAV